MDEKKCEHTSGVVFAKNRTGCADCPAWTKDGKWVLTPRPTRAAPVVKEKAEKREAGIAPIVRIAESYQDIPDGDDGVKKVFRDVLAMGLVPEQATMLGEAFEMIAAMSDEQRDLATAMFDALDK